MEDYTSVRKNGQLMHAVTRINLTENKYKKVRYKRAHTVYSVYMGWVHTLVSQEPVQVTWSQAGNEDPLTEVETTWNNDTSPTGTDPDKEPKHVCFTFVPVTSGSGIFFFF